MNVVLYTKTTCPSCLKAKNLLKLRDIEYVEYVINDDITREEFVSLFPEVKTVPFIIIDGVKIGGYEQLERTLDDHKQA